MRHNQNRSISCRSISQHFLSKQAFVWFMGKNTTTFSLPHTFSQMVSTSTNATLLSLYLSPFLTLTHPHTHHRWECIKLSYLVICASQCTSCWLFFTIKMMVFSFLKVGFCVFAACLWNESLEMLFFVVSFLPASHNAGPDWTSWKQDCGYLARKRSVSFLRSLTDRQTGDTFSLLCAALTL